MKNLSTCYKKVAHGVVKYLPCWPQRLNVELLRRAHVIDSFYHLGRHKLKGQLSQLLHIRGFENAYKQIQCEYCIMNTRQPRQNLPLGVPFLVTSPRTVLSLDVGFMNMNFRKPAFLTILDVSCHFLAAYPVTANASATEIYSLLYTRYFSHSGLPLAIVTDNGSAMSNTLISEICALSKLIHVKISPRNSKANRSEASVKFLLHILRGMQQSKCLNEDNFEMALGHA